jgi:hypothetical protein
MASSVIPQRQRATGTSPSRVDAIRQLVAIGIVIAIQVILVLGFVAMSLGLGVEGHPGGGPDRVPRPAPAGAVLPGFGVGRA